MSKKTSPRLKYLTLLLCLIPALAMAQTILPGSRGGTGFATTTGGNIGNCLSVSTNNPIVYTFSGCAGGSGSAFEWTPTSYGNATGTTLGFLNGFLSTASSTIVGNATTTGTFYAGIASSSKLFGSFLTPCTVTNALTWTGGVFGCVALPQGTVTAVTGTYPIISSGGATPAISTAFTTTTNNGVGNDVFLYNSHTGIMQGAASSSLNLPNSALANSTISGISLGNTLAALTINNGGAGVASGGTYTGNAGVTISYNSIGAVPTTRNINTSFPIQGGGDLSADRTITTAFSTTSNSGMSQGFQYVGSGGIFQTGASSTLFGYTPLNPTRQLTVAGTGQQITSSAGAQDLSADRTWTLSLPAHVKFPTDYEASAGSTTNATTTGTLYLTLAALSQRQLYVDSTGLVVSGGTGTSGNCVQWGANNLLGDAGAACGSGSGGAFPFTVNTGYNSTTSVIGFITGGIFVNAASSTIQGNLVINGNSTTTNATTTAFEIAQTASTTNLNISAVPNALLLTSSGGKVGAYGGASACSSNNFVTTISATGGTTCGTAAISGINLGSNLNSFSVGSDFTGTSYNGSAAVSDWALKMSQGHTWTALQQFNGGASSTGEISAATASSTNLVVSGVRSALFLAGVDGTASAYAGSSPCTNQVDLSLSATGVITCTSVTDAMLSSTFLKVDPNWSYTTGPAISPTSTLVGILVTASSTIFNLTALTSTTTAATTTALEVAQLASTTNLRASSLGSALKTNVCADVSGLLTISGCNNGTVTSVATANGFAGTVSSGAITLTTSLTAGLVKANGTALVAAAYTDFPTISANSVLGNVTAGALAPASLATSSLFTGTVGQTGWFSGTGTLVGTTSLNFTAGTSTLNSDVVIQKTSPNVFQILDQFASVLLNVNTASTTGSIFTVAASTSPNLNTGAIKLFDIDQYGAITASSTGPAAPALTNCAQGGGSASLTAGSNDTIGSFTTGTLATSCTITFARAKTVTPAVFVEDNSTAATIDVSAQSTTAFTVSISAGISGAKIYYWVVQGPSSL